MTLSIQQWKDTGLLPTTAANGMLSWHQFEAAVSGHNIAYDYSGNGRNMSCGAGNSPQLTTGVIDGQAGWYFNGSRDPLVWSGSITPKHAFVVASADEATFADYRGLLGGVTTGDMLVGNTGVNKFVDYTATGYYLSGFPYIGTNQLAPMKGVESLVEIQFSGGTAMDGIQVGKQKGFARLWKGYFIEAMLFNRVLSAAERKRVMLYFNLKYGLFRSTALKLYFPSDDFMIFKRRRFYAEPPMYDKITDSFEFEDGGKTFNERADTPPRRWEYTYELVNQNGSTRPAEVTIFDEFFDRVRYSRPFYFVDKFGVEHSNVFVEKYERNHSKNMPWRQSVSFSLIKYP